MLFLCVVLGVCLAVDVLNTFSNLKILKLTLGYIWLLELTLSIALTFLSIITGSVTAAVSSAISVLVLTIILFLFSKYYGYAKIERDGFKLKIVNYGPSLGAQSTGRLVRDTISSSLRSLGGFLKGVRHA